MQSKSKEIEKVGFYTAFPYFEHRDTEERAQILEERAISAETQLKEAQERIRALERSVRRSSQDSTCSSKRPTTGRLSAASTLLESENDTPVPDKSPSNSRPASGK